MRKIYTSCMSCLEENGVPNLNFVELEQNNDLIYKMICDKGHETVLIQQASKFEIIFDMACESFINEDYTAAVKHCATAVERFHEFFVQCVWFNDTNRYDESVVSYEKYWKEVKSASERQLGCFYSFYFKHYDRLEYAMSNGETKFRNNVVHKGEICGRKKSCDYLTKSYNYMISILQKIYIDFEEGLHNTIRYNLNKLYEKYSQCKIVTMSEGHIINTIAIDDIKNPKNFDIRMKEYFEFQKLMKRHYAGMSNYKIENCCQSE